MDDAVSAGDGEVGGLFKAGGWKQYDVTLRNHDVDTMPALDKRMFDELDAIVPALGKRLFGKQFIPEFPEYILPGFDAVLACVQL